MSAAFSRPTSVGLIGLSSGLPWSRPPARVVSSELIGPDGRGRAVAGGMLVDLQNFSAGNPEHLDPGLSGAVEGSEVSRLLFDGLTENDHATGHLRPMVAESWESNDEGDEWTFQLRDGATFHNGDAVLPSDFKFAWERVLASHVASHLDVSGDAGPLGVLPRAQGRRRGPRRSVPVGARGDDRQRPVPDVRAVGQRPLRQALERYDDHWGGLNGHSAYLDVVEFRISGDLDSAFQAFQAGEGDEGDTAHIPPARFPEVLPLLRPQ